jgi:hypothetical protein
MPLTIVRALILLPLFSAVAVRPLLSPATKVRVTVATLHAAALTKPRASTDSVDGPYFLVSILGPKSRTETLHLPTSGHLTIHEDEALGARALADLTLKPGDSVRLLVSVLEGKKVQVADEAAAAAGSSKALSQPTALRLGALSSALTPLTSKGAHWLGSATLLLTNEGGEIYWRALECVSTCKVLSGGTATRLGESGKAPVSGIVELSGAGGTYHMQLKGEQAS